MRTNGLAAARRAGRFGDDRAKSPALRAAAKPFSPIRIFLCAILGLASIARAQAKPPIHIDWDRSTLTLIQQGGVYARMARIGTGLICCFENRGRCFVRASSDEGKTWHDPIEAAACDFGNAANPELLSCRDGQLMLFYNERPRDGDHPFTIRLSISKDNGNTWAADPHVLYAAGNQLGNGCYEPSAIQLLSGEIQLFFANEYPHRTDGSQEITLLRSTNNGSSWQTPQAVSYRAKHRDGMPVPIVLLNQKGIAFAIEDNGITTDHEFKPTIIHTANMQWPRIAIGAESSSRWGAVDTHWGEHVYAGAPYLRQLPTGETLLSCQTNLDRKVTQMTVFIGDADAKHFGNPSDPFQLDANTKGMWNSLFVKNRDTVTAISSTNINGKSGVWAIDGHIVRN